MVDNDDKLFKEITLEEARKIARKYAKENGYVRVRYIGYEKGIYRFDVTPDFAEEYYKETGETMMIGMPFFLEVFEFSGTALITQDPF
ncbi:hypothetical protein EBB69_03350 [Lactobacillus delbrueckii]|uniref:hypothetical protein n=1 Tax=Lactobacillus delbrueckii TaxID=1584 RepID=UPI001C703F04|nr:hypothetical protein [Lactobacillus delbrueckii]MBW9308098.1 hypothetical protein [Lactobacillus delbrueckii]